MKHAPLLLMLALAACAPAAQPVGAAKTIVMQPIGVLVGGKQSTVMGTVKISNFDNGRTRLEVQLSNIPARTKHSGAIFKGSCNNRNSTPTLLLPEISGDERGLGQISTEVETAKLPAPGYIVFYQRGRDEQGGIGDPITCGDLR
jgi:hypothetical protein